MSFLDEVREFPNNFQMPRLGCLNATLAYHKVWHQVEINPDPSKIRQILNKEEHSFEDALLRDCNRMYSEPGESLKDWLLRLGWLEVRDGVTVPVDAPEGCAGKCRKCDMYDTCVIQQWKRKKEA